MGRKRHDASGWTLRRENERSVWYVRFRPAPGARTVERSTGCRDKATADVEAARIVARARAGAAAEDRRPARRGAASPLGPLIAQWLLWLEATHARTTIKTWAGYATSHFQPFFGSTEQLTDEGAKAYQRDRLTKVEGVTVRKEQTALRSLCDYAFESKAITAPVVVPKLPKRATGTTYARRTRRAAPPLSAAETVALIRKLPEWSTSRKVDRFPIRARFIVGYETGLRPSTLDRLTVPKHYRPGSSVLRLDKETVKERWARDVPLTRRARRVLDYLLRCYGRGYAGPVFGWHNYREHLAEAAKVALSPETAERFCGAHLRSAMLTHRLDAGAPITGVQWLVGHTLLSTTARYVKPGFATAVEALDSRRR
jgi:integrase